MTSSYGYSKIKSFEWINMSGTGPQDILTKSRGGQNTRAAHPFSRQQTGPLIPSDQVIRSRRIRQVQQPRIMWVYRLVLPRQSIKQRRPLQVVDHPAHSMRFQHVPEFGIPAGPPDFLKLDRTVTNSKRLARHAW
jgi:hypothetical protein